MAYGGGSRTIRWARLSLPRRARKAFSASINCIVISSVGGAGSLAMPERGLPERGAPVTLKAAQPARLDSKSRAASGVSEEV